MNQLLLVVVVVAANPRAPRLATTVANPAILPGNAPTLVSKGRPVKSLTRNEPSTAVASTAAKWATCRPIVRNRRVTRRATTVGKTGILRASVPIPVKRVRMDLPTGDGANLGRRRILLICCGLWYVVVDECARFMAARFSVDRVRTAVE